MRSRWLGTPQCIPQGSSPHCLIHCHSEFRFWTQRKTSNEFFCVDYCMHRQRFLNLLCTYICASPTPTHNTSVYGCTSRSYPAAIITFTMENSSSHFWIIVEGRFCVSLHLFHSFEALRSNLLSFLIELWLLFFSAFSPRDQGLLLGSGSSAVHHRGNTGRDSVGSLYRWARGMLAWLCRSCQL